MNVTYDSAVKKALAPTRRLLKYLIHVTKSAPSTKFHTVKATHKAPNTNHALDKGNIWPQTMPLYRFNITPDGRKAIYRRGGMDTFYRLAPVRLVVEDLL
jgi:hypothetical protein